MSGAVHDVITYANFGEDRLRGFGVARVRILAFSIDLLCRLYNTLALPRECMIIPRIQHKFLNNCIEHRMLSVFFDEEIKSVTTLTYFLANGANKSRLIQLICREFEHQVISIEQA